MTRVLRYEVPVDDAWHAHFAGPIVHIDCRSADLVEFWALDEDNDVQRWFRVYGTGHPTSGAYLGTALSPAVGRIPIGLLVWHLFEDNTTAISMRKEPKA